MVLVQTTFSRVINHHVTFMALLLPAIICALLILSNLNKGIDITDEGFYLAYAANASENFFHGTNFGHYTGILLSLVGDSVFGLRIIGLLLLIVATSAFVQTLLQYLPKTSFTNLPLAQQGLYYTTANCAVLTYYFAWLPTPSYNWMALLCCLLVGRSLLRLVINAKQRQNTDAAIEPSRVSVADTREAAVIGLGFVLAFMAKPTTALTLGFLTLAWVSFSAIRKQWFAINLRIGLFTVGFFIVHVLLFEQGFVAYVELLKKAAQLRAAIHGEAGFGKLIEAAVRDIGSVPYYLSVIVPWALVGLATMVVFNTIALFSSTVRENKWYSLINMTLGVVITVLAWWQLWMDGRWLGGNPEGWNLGMTSLLFTSAMLLMVMATAIGVYRTQWRLSLKTIGLIATLALMPFIFSFGSGNGLILQTSMAFVFQALTILICVAVLEQQQRVKILSLCASGLIIFSSLHIVKGAFETPYRIITPLSEQTEKVSFVGDRSELYLDAVTARYVNDLKRLALANGWQENTLLIDMSGGTPIAAFILNAKPAGAAWLIGGYKGSADGAFLNLSQVDVGLLKSAWVLTAPEGNRHHSVDVLTRLGIQFDEQYEQLGQLTTGYRNETQFLYRPRQ